jgi:hypothetical protein
VVAASSITRGESGSSSEAGSRAWRTQRQRVRRRSWLQQQLAGRLARLEAELERLSVHDRVGDLAEAALCALGPQGRT